MLMEGLLGRGYVEAAEEVVCRDPGPASTRTDAQVWRIFGWHCQIQMRMCIVLKEVEEIIDPHGNQPVFQVRHTQQVSGAVHPGTFWLLAACELDLVMCQSMQLFIGRACCGSIEALWAEGSEILAVPLTLWVAASVMVTCALS